MPTFSQVGAPPTQSVDFGSEPSVPSQLLQTSQTPTAYGPAPVAIQGCNTVDGNNFDFFQINVGSGPTLNVPVILQTPRKFIIYVANDQGGARNAVLSFNKLSADPAAPGSPLITGTFGQWFPFLSKLTFQNVQPGGGQWFFLKFCKPISRFFISSRDSGQPGENMIFLATDDLDLDAI
jgi:hypothetical protein